MSTRVLITNDDGIHSAGIATLAAAAVDAGFDVVVAAPSWDSSGASASLTAVEEGGRVMVEEASLPGLTVPAFAVEAAPAFIVRAGMSGAFGTPFDAVLSGVNRGENLGHVVLHSGTVGAVLTAATYGLPGLAASLGDDRSGTWQWDTARVALEQALPALRSLDGPVTFNLNVPAVAPSDLRGVAAARLARFGAVQATVTEAGAGWVKLAYEPAAGDFEPGTDAALLADGYATLTPLIGVCEGSFDLLDTMALARPVLDGAR
jgi:5'-nucleotidase